MCNNGYTTILLDIRLEYGCEGKLQVMSSDDGSSRGGGDVVWLDVCSGEFGQSEAEVVCRQLRCGGHSLKAERLHPSR